MKHTLRALALISISSALLAEETPQKVQELPTTIVTADIWETALEQSTASVTLIDSEALKSNGGQHFEDVINTIPNLTWTGGSSRPRFIQIRGIGENSQFEGETPDSSVRFLIDDFDLTGLGAGGNLFDVQQIEVLRGPQAGAFGANAAGAVIQIVTNDPTPYWTGQAEATVGTDSLFAEGFAIGGPILTDDPERLTFRVSVHQLNQDGFHDNKVSGDDDTNKRDEFTSRLKMRWIANEDWQFDAGLLYANIDNDYDEFSLNNSRTKTYTDDPGEDNQETLGSSFRSTWLGLDKIQMSTTTSFTTSDSTYSYDTDWGTGDAPGSLYPSGYTGFLRTDRDRDVFNQEIRFDSKGQQDALWWIDRWTVGFYYQNFDEDTDIDYSEASEVDLINSYSGVSRAKTDYETDTYAGFAQAGHNINERTRLTLGVRYEYHDVDFKSKTVEDTLGYLGSDQGTINQDNNLWGAKLALEYEITDTQMAYGSITRGYKAGGSNSGIFQVAGDPETYDDETLWNYELGLRSDWFDGELISSINVFYLDRDDAQLRDSAGAGGFFRYFTSNQGDAEHYGLEAETTWFFAENWSASASLGLLETELDNTGDDLANAPNYNYSARIDYRPLDGLFASLEVVGSDDYYESNSLTNSEKRSSFAVVNASIGYRIDRWTITVWSKNLLDEEYEERVYFFDNFDPATTGDQRYESPAAPRTFGVTANYAW